jgi:hypothetical protein
MEGTLLRLLVSLSDIRRTPSQEYWDKACNGG